MISATCVSVFGHDIILPASSTHTARHRVDLCRFAGRGLMLLSVSRNSIQSDLLNIM